MAREVLIELLKSHLVHGGLQSWELPCCWKIYGMVSHLVQATGGQKCVYGGQVQALYLYEQRQVNYSAGIDSIGYHSLPEKCNGQFMSILSYRYGRSKCEC